jgi:hypothetical protein
MRMRLLGSSIPNSRRYYDKSLETIILDLGSSFFFIQRHFSRQSKHLLDIRMPRKIQEAYDIATEVKTNISSSKVEQSFVPEVKVCEPKDTLYIPKRVPSLETYVQETLKDLEQDISQQEVEEGDIDEGYQYHGDEQEFTHASRKDNEDLVEETEPEDIKHDEVLTCAPPSDETIPNPIFLAHEEVNTVSYFPFQESDDALFYDLKSEEVLGEPLDVLNTPCYDKFDDYVDNIDEFIHVEKCKWDVIGYDGDPIYDIEGHFQKFPLQLSYEVTNSFDIWKQGDDMITNFFQTPKDPWCYVLLMISGHTLRILMNIPLSTWIYSMKKIINHRCAQILIKVRTLLSQRRILMTMSSISL